MLKNLWSDEGGALVSIEILIIATLSICALVVGWSTLRVAVVTELADVAAAVASLDQSYSAGSIIGHHAWCASQQFLDEVDSCDTDGPAQIFGLNSQCVEVCSSTDLGLGFE